MHARPSVALLPRAVSWLLSALLVLFCHRYVQAGPPKAGPPKAGPPKAEPPRAAAILGEWWTEKNEGRVRFARDPDGTFQGVTTCCAPAKASPNQPTTDIHNPDPKLRGRSTIGIVIIWKLAYEDGKYSGGYVYNPRDGKTYRFTAELLDPDTLSVRGYLWIPMLGQSQIWKRYR